MGFEILSNKALHDISIKVIGVGGGGNNAVNHMIRTGAEPIDFIAVNTDHKALIKCEAPAKIQLGTTGLGAGSRPEVGRTTAIEKEGEIRATLEGTDLLFITAGMGGGTGTGAAPVIAQIAKDMGILTVAVVTKPFSFEGGRRMLLAEAGIKGLEEHVDALLVILNEKLETTMPDTATMQECFKMTDDILYKACVGIPAIIHTPGVISVDFEDLRTIMSQRGPAIFGLASASGENRVTNAMLNALSCPLLEGARLQNARGLLVYFTSDESLTLTEVRQAMDQLKAFQHPNAEIILGTAIDPSMGNEVRVTLLATGLQEPSEANEALSIAVASQQIVNPVVMPTIPTLSSTPNATTASTLATTPTVAPALAPTSTATETQTNNAPKPQATQAEPKTTPTETPKPATQASATTTTFKHFEIPTYLRNF